MTTYNINEVANILGIESNQRLRDWEDRFNIEIGRGDKGFRFYTDENIELFKKIKEFYDNKLTTSEIKIKLGITSDEQVDTPAGENDKNNTSIELLKNDITNHIENRFDKFLEISESLSKASYRIGYLEADLKSSNEKLEELQNKLIESSKLLDQKDKEINRLKNEYEKKITSFEVDLNAKNKENYNLMSELKDKNSTLDQLNIKLDINQKKLDEVNMNIEKFNQLGFWGKGNFKF